MVFVTSSCHQATQTQKKSEECATQQRCFFKLLSQAMTAGGNDFLARKFRAESRILEAYPTRF